ncbi:MAG: hypothetical protein IPQ19_15465 [Bacteroidetes bacterium]|nr:hypothetical protein [Bacteroidota bacterium]
MEFGIWKSWFLNAIVCNIQPDSAKWDAGDIRYNVIRWTASPTPPFGGYGPSFCEPSNRTNTWCGYYVRICVPNE